jgi:hypothetical protein
VIAEFTRFLRDRAAKDELVAALGDRVEAHLLARWDGGRLETEWEGRRAWVGTTVPPLARGGDLWLDVTEMMPMLVVRRAEVDENVFWMAMRPVERWQLAGFLNVAKPAVRLRYGGRWVFDRDRLLGGDERAPVTNIMREEAWVYAGWFGKGLFDRVGWQLAAEVEPPEQIAALWGPVREWDGEVYEGAYSDVAPATVDDVPIEDDDYPWIYGEGAASEQLGFRTEVHLQLGLYTRPFEHPELKGKPRSLAPRDTEPVVPTPLTDALVAFLQTGAAPGLGDRLEARLLAEGRTTPGDGVWLDLRDLTPMRGGLALRPVERWQFGAFLRITKLPATATRGGTDLLDRTRLLARPETEPLTEVLREEASLYAHWAGKRVAGRADWRRVPPAQRDWGPIREWAEDVAPGVVAVVDADSVDIDPVAPEGRHWRHDPQRLTFLDWETPKDVGFRTAGPPS